MTDIVLERLANRLWKCPFDQELFDSSLRLRLHLCESHGGSICQRRRVPHQLSIGDAERPKKLTLCGHCLGYAVPDTADRNAISEIARHIREVHPNPFGPAILTFSATSDSTLIDQFMEQQTSQEVCACSSPDCPEVFSDEASVALHWVENHRAIANVDETRLAVEAHPEGFGTALGDCLVEVFAEEMRTRLSIQAPEDGYIVHHCPSVPRVRSKPSESLVFIERESVRFVDTELEQLLEYEGLDFGDEENADENWGDSMHQTIRIELRFCNIEDGYIPRVKELRRILPPLADGDEIEVSWHEEPQIWFPCKVSKTKRAIYNLEGRLKRSFKQLPSGVRLYITRVGARRYQLQLKHQPHIVPNCKFFLPDGLGAWKVEVRNEAIEWETGDAVFRHQLTFEQMEALREEARQTNLSVRDAVYEVMRRLGPTDRVHVRTVYDTVFLWMRTCSLAAVWAQFRPEHQCYVRVEPGWYRFDQFKPFPAVQFVSPQIERNTSRTYTRPNAQDGNRYRIKQCTWRHNIYASRLKDYRNNEDACLEVRCGFGTPSEVVFVIPIPFLTECVIPNADCNNRGQYLFTVNQHDFVFTWDHGFKMEGRQFLISPRRSER